MLRTRSAFQAKSFLRALVLVGVAAVLAGLLLAGCGPVQSVREALREATPHEQYAASLRKADLDDTAVGRAWLAAGERAVREALPVDVLSFREVGYLSPTEPDAVGYRFRARRGQQVRLRVTPPPPDSASQSARFFIDLFAVPADTAEALRHVASADSTHVIETEVERDGAYVLRVQPELLRGGRYRLTIQAGASLAFPVSGIGSEAIRSVFGDPRDGGAREHHGVDIFAPRGTPVVAAAPGVVTRVRTGGLGGKVVWLRDDGRRALYYAHLDSQIARPRTRVAVGDTLGLVGNTGNARTTPPHLHFGIYAGGPVDPYPFIHEPRAAPPPVTADTSRLGRWNRVAGARLHLRAGPTTDASILRALPRYAAVQVTGSSGAWHRVRLPEGPAGYVFADLTEPAAEPFRRVTLAAGQPFRAAPSATAAAIDSAAAGTSVDALGTSGRFLYVRASDQRTGWVQAD